MRRKASNLRWALAGAGLALALAVGAVAVAASPPPGKSLGEYFLGPKLARAEVVLVINGQVHDFRIDRGRIKSFTQAGLELRQLDGTIQLVPVSPDAVIEGPGGRRIGPAQLRRGLVVVTIRDGDAPAERVVVVSPKRLAGG
ncbi:MAG: hypothetical protein ABR521_06525 [Gaiellaceae bacterium]